MNPDPQYAVLLKGKWGCGKTHFINHWIDAYKGNPTTEQVLESIYVSLYGLSDTKQITTAIYVLFYMEKLQKQEKSWLKLLQQWF